MAFCFEALNSYFLSPLRLWLLVNMFVYLLDGFKWLTCMQMCWRDWLAHCLNHCFHLIMYVVCEIGAALYFDVVVKTEHETADAVVTGNV